MTMMVVRRVILGIADRASFPVTQIDVVAGRAALPELLDTAGAKKRFMAPRCKQNLEPILRSKQGRQIT